MKHIGRDAAFVLAISAAQVSLSKSFITKRCLNRNDRPNPLPVSPRKNIWAGKEKPATTSSTAPLHAETKNGIYSLLATGRDQKPNRGNFFFNDEVSSHLYGYMYLVGFLFAQDPLFLGSFLVFSGLAAWATQESLLPANPRVPAVTATATLTITLLVRYGLGIELPVQDIVGSEFYQGPTEYALALECGICALNILWGVFGTWRTKEPQNGATYGF